MIVRPVKRSMYESDYMQRLKIKEEMAEADDAARTWANAEADCMDDDFTEDCKRNYALEIGDIIVAAVTLLRYSLGYDETMIDELMKSVELKDRRRGYYDNGERTGDVHEGHSKQD